MVTHKINLFPLISLLLFGWLASSSVYSASFDCAKAQTEIKKLICDDPVLSAKDDQMNQLYEQAKKNATNPERLKRTQVNWLKGRNRCMNWLKKGNRKSAIGCLEITYKRRIKELRKYAAIKTARTGPRYRLVEGKGYSICEAYLKHLNAFPPETPPMVCNIRPNPKFSNITQPDWEEIDVNENIHLIYAAEMQYPPFSLNRYDPDKSLPTFDEWKPNFDARVRAGKIKPKLYRTRLAINKKGGIETLIGYAPDPDRCERDLQNYNSGKTRWAHIYVLNDDPNQPMKAIGGAYGSHKTTRILIYRNRPFFAWGASEDFETWGLGISAASPNTTFNKPKAYVLLPRCKYHFDKDF